MDIQYLDRPEGRIAFSTQGVGPLVVIIPGMGDLVGTFREQTAELVAAGYRVALMDLPGHGASDTTFTRYDDPAIAGHALALIDHLGEPGVILGNSVGGAAAVCAAAENPDAVAGLVLSAPFIRGSSNAAMRMLYRVLISRPWGVRLWATLYRSSFSRGPKPAWFDEHLAAIVANLRRTGHLEALRSLAMQLDHSVVTPLVSAVSAPTFIVVGSADPDYPDATAELAFMGEQLHAETMLVEGVAHYPHHQAAELVTPRILAFVDGLRDGDGWRARA
jgi:pimeloyl-ACP methyl ester carboxylesterase